MRNFGACLIAFFVVAVAAHAQSAPSITGLSLPQGPPQVGLIITGAGFGGSQGNSTVVLQVGNTPISIFSVTQWSDSQIVVQVRAGTVPPLSGDVVVTVGTQSSPVSPPTTSFVVVDPFDCPAVTISEKHFGNGEAIPRSNVDKSNMLLAALIFHRWMQITGQELDSRVDSLWENEALWNGNFAR